MGFGVGEVVGDSLGVAVGDPAIGAAVGVGVTPAQQSRKAPWSVGQQLPVSCMAAHVGCAPHDAADVAVGAAVGDALGSAVVTAVGAEVVVGVMPAQQSRVTFSIVGQQLPVSFNNPDSAGQKSSVNAPGGGNSCILPP